MRGKVIAAVAALMLCASVRADFDLAPTTWEFRDGRWQQVSSAATTRPVADPTLDDIEQMLVHGQSEAAQKLALAWVKAHREIETPLRDRAIYLLGEAEFQNGDPITAFYYFDEVMDEYPDSDLYYSALQRQYDIADAMLEGYKRKLFGFPILSGEEEGVDMLYRIQSRSPGSPLAEKALLRTADYYFATSQFDVAADAYAAYAKSYPRSPVLGRVKLRQAYATLAQFRGTMFDPTPLIDSRALLTDISQAYPDLASTENVHVIVDRIDDTFARKLYNTADFYKRTNEPGGAVYMYRFLIATYPNSPEAAKAKAQLAQFDPKYLKGPQPAPGNGYAPAVAPVEGLR